MMKNIGDRLCDRCNHDRIYHYDIHGCVNGCVKDVDSSMSFHDRMCGCPKFQLTFDVVITGVEL